MEPKDPQDDEWQRLAHELAKEDDDLFGGFLASLHHARARNGPQRLAVAGANPEEWTGLLNGQSAVTVGAAGRLGIDAARGLAEAARRGSLSDRRQAHIAIAEIVHTLAEPYRGRIVNQPRSFAAITAFEQWLRVLRTQVPRVRWSTRFQQIWTPVGFLVTLVASGFLVDGHIVVAVAVLATRTALSLTMATPGFAGDARARAQWRVDWKACAVGHLTDAVSLSAVSGYLLAAGRTGWGMATALVPIAALGGTLLRLAASQGGVVLGRLYIERLARTGVLLAGLALASVVGARNGAVPAIAVASAGAAAYAIVETTRTLIYTSNRLAQDIRDGPGEAFTRRFANIVPMIDVVVDTSTVGERLAG